VEVGEALGKAARDLKRNCTFIASSDFTHYEPQELAKKVDANLIEAILRMDVPELYSRVYRYEATACGYGPIAAVITATRALGATVASSFDTRQAEMSPATTISRRLRSHCFHIKEVS